MFDFLASLFGRSLFDFALMADDPTDTLKVAVFATFNTILRGTVLAGFTYGAIRVVITAVSHGSF